MVVLIEDRIKLNSVSPVIYKECAGTPETHGRYYDMRAAGLAMGGVRCVEPVSAAGGVGAGRMRAWRVHAYGALGELRLEEARVPPLRAPDDVLVRVAAASLNPLDVAMVGGYGARALNTLRALDGDDDVEFPLVPGRDFAGTVERAGPAARLRRGQRVWGVVPPHRQGSHAQFVVVKDQWAGPAPTALDDSAAGGALYAALTASAALRAGGLGGACSVGTARVLLLGLGGVGQAALQLLAQRRADVTVGCSADLAPLALRLGAARALDRRLDDYESQMAQYGPYDVVLECAGLGGAAAQTRGLRFARFVTLSTPLLREMDARGPAAGALCAGAALLAQTARLGRRAPAPAALLPPHVRWAFFSPSAADVELLRRLAERRQFSVCVERVFPWWSGADAYARAAAGAARGKLVLDFTADEPADARR